MAKKPAKAVPTSLTCGTGRADVLNDAARASFSKSSTYRPKRITRSRAPSVKAKHRDHAPSPTSSTRSTGCPRCSAKNACASRAPIPAGANIGELYGRVWFPDVDFVDPLRSSPVTEDPIQKFGALFERDGDRYVPTPLTRGPWDPRA